MASHLRVWNRHGIVCCVKAPKLNASPVVAKRRIRPVKNVAPDVQRSYAGEEERLPQIQSILESPSWSQLFEEKESTVSTSESEIQSLLSESISENEVEWPFYMRVDALVRFLVNDGQFDRAAELLEKCAAVDVVRDDSLGMFFKACQQVNRFDVAAEVGRRWIESGMKHFRGHSANYLTYAGFMSQEVDETLYLLRLMHKNKIPFKSDYPYAITIHACNDQERWDNALDVYYLFHSAGLGTGSVLIRNLLETAINGDLPFLFRQLTDEILETRERVTWDLFKCLMKSCKHFKDLDRAKDVFGSFLWNQRHRDSRCVNTLLSIYKDSGEFLSVEEVIGFFERLGLRPDCYTFGLLLKCAYKTQQTIEVIDQILEESRAWNVQSNPVIVISACACYLSAKDSPPDQRLTKAIELLLSTEHADQACYHLVMDACMDRGHTQDAQYIKSRMEAAGFPADDVTAGILEKEERQKKQMYVNTRSFTGGSESESSS